MSEGTEHLIFRKPATFAVMREVRVLEDGVPIPFLNELECVNGSVYANSWRGDFIVRIDPATGRVQERIDASGLLTEREAKDADVLNGIAYDPADGTFLLTGKRWPKVFRVRFVPAGT
jgi:glutaminyl-peptide cyclotransferase